VRPDLFLVGVAFGAAGFALGRWQRDRVAYSHRRILAFVFKHLDEVIGATKSENARRASYRFKIRRIPPLGLGRVLGGRVADLFWPPVPQAGGIAALPGIRRMGRYVKLGLPARPKWRPWHRFHRWDVRWVEVHYSSEAGANAPNFIEWLERGRPVQGGGLAQALGLEWAPGLFEHKRDWSRDRVRFDRTRPAVVPSDFDLRGEVNGGG